MTAQYGLGRGLASLIPPRKDDSTPKGSPFSYPDKKSSGTAVSFPQDAGASDVEEVAAINGGNGVPLEIPIDSIVPNPHQPRLTFDEVKLAELTESIREHGVLQPLVVTKRPDGTYELIAGERRFQASKRAGLKTVPVVLREAGEQEKLELAIIENVQRHDLNPIEEAKAYLRLAEEFRLHQDEIAKKMGKSRSTVANALRLLTLPIEIQRAIIEGRISEGHAKALLSIENSEKQRALFEMIVSGGMTVRETEAKAREISVKPHTRHARDADPDMIAKENELAERLKTKVKIVPVGKGGRVVIEFYSKEELEQFLGRL